VPALLLVAVLLAATSACGGSKSAPAETGTIAVTVQPARLETLRSSLSVPGIVVVSAMADFTVTALEPAPIVEMPKAEGEAVKEGDVLVKFDFPSISSSLVARQVEVNEASLKLETARAEVTRLSAYFDKGIVPRNMVDAARASAAAAEIALNQAKNALDAAKALGERQIVRARFSGVVAKVWHKAGDIVAADVGDPILRVIDPSRTQVAAQAPVAQVERILPGLTATVTSAMGAPEAASVSSRSVAGAATTTAEIRLSFQAPSALKVDTPVQVEILFDERKDVVVAPEPAIVREGAATYVWIARADGRAERREVRLGLTVKGLSQVVSGLAVGDRVITSGLAQLQDGTPITISR
jgi:membrane fusion protein (multidrug efflux system)